MIEAARTFLPSEREEIHDGRTAPGEREQRDLVEPGTGARVAGTPTGRVNGCHKRERGKDTRQDGRLAALSLIGEGDRPALLCTGCTIHRRRVMVRERALVTKNESKEGRCRRAGGDWLVSGRSSGQGGGC